MSEATAALSGENGGAPEGTPDTGAPAATPSWTDGLGEDATAMIQNKGWKGVGDVLNSYRNLEKFAGGAKNLVELPGDDADEDAISSFYAKLGRPDSPDNYGFQAPDGADAELDGWFRNVAHQNGLSDKQAASLYNAWNEMSVSRVEAMQTALKEQAEADIKAIKKELGGEYEKFLHSGKTAVKALGYDEAKLSALEEKIGTGEMLRLFGTIGAKMGEGEFVDGGSSESFGLTPAQAQHQLGELRLDKGFMDRYLSGDKDAVAKYTRLMKAAHGG